ncbi:HAMP domain-containing methyl-accepting chemotaxis protein [Oscillospiraceae bacterium MB08-C2-2]|nr:HAMP domain-containing methyl-accepting chemotaxis protein [Oscillospiraceae bacterium MB08-C2-2]
MKNFKDFNIARKILTGFLVLVLLTLLVGGVGAFGMANINQMDTYLYEMQTKPIGNLINALDALYQIRLDLRNAIISAGNTEQVAEYEKKTAENVESFRRNLEEYRPTITADVTIALLEETNQFFENTYVPLANQVMALSKANKQADANAALNKANDQVTLIFDNMNQIVANRMTSAQKTSDSNGQTSIILMIVLVGVIVVSAVVATVMGLRISNIISKPIGQVVNAANQIALGRVDVDLSDINSKDETGELAGSFMKMLAGIREQVAVAELISNGDFTQVVPLRSDEDVLGLALQKIERDLSHTLQIISTAADQVNTGANQVSSASQALASGAAEQAATVEELNASIASVTQQAEQNVGNVRKATEHVNQVGHAASESNQYMQRLDKAMGEIGESSQQISKITKLVEDIAFQTNILALNAAVEAARAGNAGKGFAVVADEVRNLAAKSAEAAKQTADLIQKSVSSIAEGGRLAAETLKLLENVSDKAQLVDHAIRQIESASTEQAGAIEQINQGLTQVSAVVQTNAATAEESSASSEELAGQAQTLQDEVSRFKLAEVSKHFSLEIPSHPTTPAYESESSFALLSGVSKY